MIELSAHGHEHLFVDRFSICFIVTSDSVLRGLKTDEIRPIAENLGSQCPKALLNGYVVIGNSIGDIRKVVLDNANRCDVIVVSGGTGISRKDVSVEAVEPVADKALPGFGELFRAMSYRDVGARAYLSRASAYVVNSSLVFIVPGNPNAVKLALEIICEIAPHALYEARR